MDWLNLVILVLGIPVGYLIAWMARDELIVGRKWFKTIIIAGIVGMIGFYIFGIEYAAWASAFAAIIAFVGYMKSYDLKWTEKIA